jgi:N-acetylglucosaminyl-diphospho-decaprenol L-rhamnosyltransferase
VRMSRGATTSKAVDVAIVNWNTSEAALAAARAFAASTEIEARVTIVDNGSAAEQRRLLEQRRGGLERESGERIGFLLEENLGYGTAANRALASGKAALVCVSNADVVPEPRALAELAAVAEGEPAAGMVGPVFGGDADHYHAELPTGPTLLGRIFVGGFRRGGAPAPDRGAIAEVGQPSGACFLMRRETWQRIGGFDEGFFLWYEDVDLAKRLRDAGFRNLVVGSARVDHATAESFRQLDNRAQQAIRLPSLGRYIEKHHPRLLPIAAPLLRLSTRLRARGGERPQPANGLRP